MDLLCETDYWKNKYTDEIFCGFISDINIASIAEYIDKVPEILLQYHQMITQGYTPKIDITHMDGLTELEGIALVTGAYIQFHPYKEIEVDGVLDLLFEPRNII